MRQKKQKQQQQQQLYTKKNYKIEKKNQEIKLYKLVSTVLQDTKLINPCLLYTSPSPRDATLSRMPSSA